jgi:hypothetical protein
MHSKRIYLENNTKPVLDKSDLENFNTLNLCDRATAEKVGKNTETHRKQDLRVFQPKQLKIIPESKHHENSSAKIMPNPKNVFLNLKNNIQADKFTSAEKADTLDFFTKKSCLTLGEDEASETLVKNTIGSPKVSRFIYNSSRQKPRGFFNFDTEDFEAATSESEDTDNYSYSTSVNRTQQLPDGFLVDTEGASCLKNPADYKLRKSTHEDLISPTKITHKYLPYTMVDNEKYKSRLFSFLRKPEYSDHKTETRKLKPRKFSEAYGKLFNYLDGNITKYYSLFDLKRKKINSQKKVFESDKYFMSDMNGYTGPQAFKIYYDRDIGFTSRWQVHLKETVRLFRNL